MPTATIAPYRHERPLFFIVATVSLLFWVPLIGVSIYQPVFGAVVLTYAFAIWFFSLIARSGLISFLKGNAVRLGDDQLPDLYARVVKYAGHVGLARLPEAYLMSGNGALNAFATRFLRRYYIILLSDVIDSLEDDPEAINFYIGHELGHIHRKHLAHAWWTAIGRILPIVGAAYRRAEEYTCDNYGRACCASQASAVHALAVLAAGQKCWKTLNANAYADQCAATGGFWMSINEITSDYPWLCKRLARMHSDTHAFPRRNPLAWLLAALMPRFGPGGLAMNLIFMAALIGMLVAIAVPKYQDYAQRKQIAIAFAYGEALTEKAQAYFIEHRALELPEPLSKLGVVAPATGIVEKAEFDPESHVIRLILSSGKFIEYHAQTDTEEMSLNDGDTSSQNNFSVSGWECVTSLPQKVIPQSVDCLSFANPFGASENTADDGD